MVAALAEIGAVAGVHCHRLLQHWRLLGIPATKARIASAISALDRFITTPESSEHRVFIFVPRRVVIQGSLFALRRADWESFGVLSSRIHEVWATAQGNRLGVGNQRRYNIGVSFETFPFPVGLTPNIPPRDYAADPRAIAIAKVAAELNQLRDAWLNPADLVTVAPEDRADGGARRGAGEVS